MSAPSRSLGGSPPHPLSAPSRRSAVLVGLLAATFGAAAAFRSAASGGVRLALPESHVALPVAYARIGALAFDGLAADLLWLRFVQAVPLQPADEATGRMLANRLQAVVNLDPDFRSAYYHGSVLVSVLGNQPCAAVEVLEQAMRRDPTDWRLPFQAGYNCFAELGNMECAARQMQRAAALEGAPPWLPGLVARLLSDASRRDAAIEYLEGQLKRTDDPRLKERFAERLREAVLARDLARIDDAVRTFRRTNGHLPASVEILVAEGILPPLPARDPFGGSYVLGENGRARSTSGRSGLKTFNTQSALTGDVRERMLEERVVARLGVEGVGRPGRSPLVAAVEARARLLGASLHGVESFLPLVEDEDDRIRLRTVEARVLIALDLERLRKAWIARLREDPSALPSIDALHDRAGTPEIDPFGTRYGLAPDGKPVPAESRHPFVAVSGDGRGSGGFPPTGPEGGSRACR